MANNNSILQNRINAAQGSITGRSYTDAQSTNLSAQDEKRQTEIEIMNKVKAQINIQFREKILSDAKNPEFIAKLQSAIEMHLEKESKVADVMTRKTLVKKILDDILGFGPLQELLEDDKVTEIMISNWQKTYVERDGILALDTNIQFVDDLQLHNIIDKIVQPIGRKIDEFTPLVDARLPDGSRVNATIPPISPDGCTLTIRKFAKTKLTGHNYLEFGSLSPQMLEFLMSAIVARANIIVSGGTGSGKTTLLNMLSNYVPGKESIVTVEDSCELQLYQDNVRRLEAKPANSEGRGEIAIRELVKNCLRMRPDRIIVGEIRDGAIVDMFRAMSSGHDGSLTTIHSNNPRDLVDSTIFILFGMSDMKFTEKAIQQLVCSAVDLIVQISRLSDGSRKIMNITHVVGYGKVGGKILGLKDENIETDKIYLKDVYKFKQTGVDMKKNKIIGEYVATGYEPKAIVDKALANKLAIRKEIFDPNFDMKEEDILDINAILKEKENPKEKHVEPQQNVQQNVQYNQGNAQMQNDYNMQMSPMGGMQQNNQMPPMGGQFNNNMYNMPINNPMGNDYNNQMLPMGGMQQNNQMPPMGGQNNNGFHMNTGFNQ